MLLVTGPLGLLVFASKHRVKNFSDCRLCFDGTVVSDVSCIRNLGVFFDKTLSMEKQVSATSKSCFYQIRNRYTAVHPSIYRS